MENENLHKIEILENGPYQVSGKLPVKKGYMVPDEASIPQSWKTEDELQVDDVYWLCRCGNSKNKPFCDNSHLTCNFDGTETALNNTFDELATTFTGPDLSFKDAKVYCASGRFCMRAEGIRFLTEQPQGPESKEIAIQEAFDCPSGNLVAINKETGEKMEPILPKRIIVAEDIGKKVSGPLVVQGGVEIISSNGTKYEVRNRVTLCRCGQSRYKPFCDGSHIRVGFNDGDALL